MIERRSFLKIAAIGAAGIPLLGQPGRPRIRLFQLNEADTVAALSLADAMAFYIDQTGLPPDEAFDDPSEIPEAEWDDLRRMWLDLPGRPTSTFREAIVEDLAAGAHAPYLFSTTEW